MLSAKSPGGSKFPYYYKGGELYCLHLGNYASDEAGVIAMIKAEETFMLTQCRRICVWVDFYQTKRTDRVIGAFVQFLERTDHLLPKLALVGCSVMDRWRITHLVKKTACLSVLPIKYFDDPEDAKTWLVNEHE